MRKGLQSVLLLLISVAFLAGCETTGSTTSDTGASTGTSGSGSSGSATTSGTASGSGWTGHPLDNPDGLLSKRTVYFEFDMSEILEQDKPVLEAHARYLSSNPGASVTLEGHADERGTREYNIGLGERRANSVRQFMTLFGASGAQIRTVSYGEERPVAMGHNEEAWALNRRVEIIYRTR
ncbi:MAG: peptidoglycan-associated lipoprotein Pal [Gammaproteobacteria bacterium]|nr:peptidoglycan-associated lipoprotein Pal [Gammaproteobacteria bacterium]